MSFIDYYKLLGVSSTSTEQEIKDAYRKLSKKFHPDLNEGDSFFSERFKEIQTAYETLIDKNKRKNYQQAYNSFNNKSDNTTNYNNSNSQGSNTENSPKPKKSMPTNRQKSNTKAIYFVILIVIAIIFGIIKGVAKKEIKEKAYSDLKENHDPPKTPTNAGTYDNNTIRQSQDPKIDFNSPAIISSNYPVGYYIVQATSSDRVYGHATPNPDALIDLYYNTRKEVYIQRVSNEYGFIDEGNGPTDKYWLPMNKLILVAKDEISFNSVRENEDYILTKLRKYTQEKTHYSERIPGDFSVTSRTYRNYSFDFKNKTLIISYTNYYSGHSEDIIQEEILFPVEDFKFPIREFESDKLIISSVNENIENKTPDQHYYSSSIFLDFRTRAETDLIKNLSNSFLKLRNA